nr:hypothetical protein [Chenggangzhangella methanolivorans]
MSGDAVQGDRDLRGPDRLFADDRKLHHHDAQVRVVVDERVDVLDGAAAEAAIVVEELDQRDVALRIAEDGVQLLLVDLRHIGLQHVGALLGELGLLAPVPLLLRLVEHLWIGHEIFADDLADLLLLLGVEGERRTCGRGDQRRRGRGGGRGAWWWFPCQIGAVRTTERAACFETPALAGSSA